MFLDIIVVALILLSILLGYKKGLVKTAVSLVALIISLVVTIFLYNPIANFVVNVTNIDETIENEIYKKVLTMMEEEGNHQQEYLGITIKDADNGMLSSAAEGLAVNIVRYAVFIILLIGTRILIRFLKSFASFISGMPILSQFNRIGGSIYGLLRGLLITYIVLILVQFVTKIEPENIAYKQVSDSIVTKMMYENNIINVFFK